MDTQVGRRGKIRICFLHILIVAASMRAVKNSNYTHLPLAPAPLALSRRKELFKKGRTGNPAFLGSSFKQCNYRLLLGSSPTHQGERMERTQDAMEVECGELSRRRKD